MRIGNTVRLSQFPRFLIALLLAVSTGALAQAPQKCDVNGDGAINQTDINLIVAARNQPASGPLDPRDADNNGVINALDARSCQLRCTLANCALPPTNTAPVATGDGYSTPEDAALSVPAPGVLGNDTDAQNNPLTAALVSGPAQGTLVLSPNGSFNYTPAANFAGQVTFTYRANDGGLDSNIATVTITVTPVNDGPTAQPDGYSTPEDTALNVAAPGVLGNDGDIDNPTLTAILVSGPAASAGTLVLNANGSFGFTPAANFTGAATFTYRASDGVLLSSVTTVTVNVTPVNDAPVANTDSYSTDEDAALTVVAPGVLGNDNDIDGGGLTAVLVTPPATGALVLNPNGSFTYTPAANTSGPVSFTYRANDGALNSNPATVNITVLPVNDAPVAGNDSYSTPKNVPLAVVGPGVLGNDTDQEGNGLTAVLGTGPASGGLVLNANGSFTYTPNLDFTGPDGFTYRANDGNSNSNLATVTITVTQVANTPPVANGDGYNTPEDTALIVPAPGVLGNDTDVDGNPLTAALVSGPASGALVLNPNGSFSYTPAANFNGPVTFTYRANDGTVNSNTATVTITVNPVNDPPNATNDSYNTNINTPLTVAAPGVLGNDSDLEGNALTAAKLTDPANGTVVLNANGSFTYTPNAGFSGTDSFTYRANDGNANSNTATVTITVANNLPAVSLTATIANASEVGPTNGQFTFTRSGGNQAVALTVNYTIGAGAGQATNGVDYSTISGSITIPAAQPSATLAITVLQDNIVEAGGETVVLTLTPNAAYTISGGPATVTIADSPAVVSIAATIANASEVGPTNGQFTFTRSGGNQAVALVVNYTIGAGAGQATNGVDYSTISGSITIPAAQPTATLAITVLQDNIVEAGGETVVLTLTPNAAYTISGGAATVTIADSPAVVSIAATIANASEVGPTNGQFTFTRSGGNQAVALVVNYTIGAGAGQATNGVDYSTISGSITIPAAQPTATLAITVLQDNIVEAGGETVVLTLTPNAAYTISGGAATVTIADSPAVVSIAATIANASEAGPTNGQFTFTRSGGNQAVALIVNYAISTGAGQATNGVDYSTISGSISIPGGQPSATLAIVPQVDALTEGTETVVLTISANAAYSIGAPASATVNIADGVADAAPAVTTVSPANGATNVPFTSDLSVTFSEGVTVSGNWFQIVCPSGTRTPANSVVGGNFTATTGSVFSINPAAIFTQGESCTGTIFAAFVSDLDSNDPPDNPVANFTWSFTALTDAPPSVTATVPANGATNVAFTSDLSVSFSEGVTVSGNWFQIVCPSGTRTPANSVVGGNFTATTGSVFSINPSAIFALGETCTGTIFAAFITDLDTNDPPDAMAANFTWSFTAVNDAAPSVTATVPANGATNVAFTSDLSVSFSEGVTVSGNWFQIVCPSGTRTPANSVVGGNFTATTGSVFSINPAAIFTLGETCTGTIFAASITDLDTNDPPDAMAADFTWSFTALTDAPPSVTATVPANGATNVAFTSDLSVSFSEGVTVSGNWFQIVCPSGTRTPANSSVGGNFTATTGSVFSINPAAIFTLGETCTGTIFAAFITDLDTNDPPDAMAADFTWSFTALTDAPPSVTATVPANGATGVAFTSDLSVSFNEGVTVSGNWFQIVCPSGTRTPANSSVGGNFTATTGSVFFINPAAIFTQGETCTGTIFAAFITDLDTNDPPDVMAADFTWSFTALTDAPPSVTATVPANGATGVAFTSDLSVSFNEGVTVSGNWFQIVCPSGTRTPANSSVGGNFTATTGSVFFINPAAIFTQGETCTGTIFAAFITDLDTNDPPDVMAADFTWSFTALTDAPPSVTATVPANGATGVAFTSDLSVSFNEGVTVSGNWFQIVCPSGTRTPANSSVGGNFTATTGSVFFINPAAIFTQGETCTGTIFAAFITDLDTNDPPDAMAADFTWSFTALTDAPPSVTATVPANGATGVAFTSDLSVSFNEGVTVSGNWFQIVCPSGTRTPANSSVGGNFTATTGSVFFINPAAIFTQGETCTGTIFAAFITDLDTNDPPDAMAADFTWSFTALTDAAPSVTATVPANGATNVAVAANISVSFSEGVQVSGSWFQLVCSVSGTRTPANSSVGGNFTATTGSVFSIDPNTNFTQGETCTGTIFAANVGDLDTNDPPDVMGANFVWSFTIVP